MPTSSTAWCAQVDFPAQSSTTAVALNPTFTSPAVADDIGLSLATASRITIPATAYVGGGRALVVAECQWPLNNTGDRTLTLNHKSSGGAVKTTVTSSQQGAGNSVVTRVLLPMLIPDMATTDYLELAATQTSGGNLNVSGTVRIVLFGPKFPFFEGSIPTTSLADNTDTALSFSYPPTTDDAGWLLPSALDRLQVNSQSGAPSLTYLAVVDGQWPANVTGNRHVAAQMFDSTLATEYIRAIASSAPTTAGVCEATAGGVLAAHAIGNFIQVTANQSSGGALNINSVNVFVMAIPSTQLLGSYAGPSLVAISGVEKLLPRLPLDATALMNGMGWDSQNTTRVVFTQPGVYLVSWQGNTTGNGVNNGWSLQTAYHRDSGGVTKNTYQGRTRRQVGNTYQSVFCVVPNAVAGDYMEFGISTDNAVAPQGNCVWTGFARLP